MGKIREGRWVCQHCGEIALGRYESCPSCGVARQEGTKFYLPGDEPYVTDGELLADARSGVDWNCDHCGGANKGSVNGYKVSRCVHCGNARNGQDKDSKVIDHINEEEADFAQPASRAGVETSPEKVKPVHLINEPSSNDDYGSSHKGWKEEGPPRMTPQPKRRKSSQAWLPYVAGFLFFVMTGLLASLLISFEHPADVLSGRWETIVKVEEYQRLEREGWDHPGDARILDTDYRFKEYEKVLDGYDTVQRTVSVYAGEDRYVCGNRDLGNGYFEDIECSRSVYRDEQKTEQVPRYRDEPVYDYWYTYEVDRWVADRKVPKHGTLPTSPAWAEVNLATGSVMGDEARLGQERSENLRPAYFVTLASEGEQRELSVSAKGYLAASQGDILARKNIWGHIVGYEIPD